MLAIGGSSGASVFFISRRFIAPTGQPPLNSKGACKFSFGIPSDPPRSLKIPFGTLCEPLELIQLRVYKVDNFNLQRLLASESYMLLKEIKNFLILGVVGTFLGIHRDPRD